MSLAEFDRRLLGREYNRSTYGPVTAAELIEFARCVGETNPIYLDEAAAAKGPYRGLVAHPSFVVRPRGQRIFPEAIMPYLSRGGFDAGKDIEFGVPIRPGDTISIVASIHDVYEKTGRSGGMYFLVLRTELSNQRGEVVAVVDQRMMQKAD